MGNQVKILLTDVNSVWGVEVRPQATNIYRNAYRFANFEDKKEFVNKELFDAGKDFTKLLDENDPTLPFSSFIRITQLKGIAKINLEDDKNNYYGQRTMDWILGRDLLISKDGSDYLFWCIKSVKRISNSNVFELDLELDIFFTFSHLQPNEWFDDTEVFVECAHYDRFMRDADGKLMYKIFNDTPNLQSEELRVPDNLFTVKAVYPDVSQTNITWNIPNITDDKKREIVKELGLLQIRVSYIILALIIETQDQKITIQYKNPDGSMSKFLPDTSYLPAFSLYTSNSPLLKNNYKIDGDITDLYSLFQGFANFQDFPLLKEDLTLPVKTIQPNATTVYPLYVFMNYFDIAVSGDPKRADIVLKPRLPFIQSSLEIKTDADTKVYNLITTTSFEQEDINNQISFNISDPTKENFLPIVEPFSESQVIDPNQPYSNIEAKAQTHPFRKLELKNSEGKGAYLQHLVYASNKVDLLPNSTSPNLRLLPTLFFEIRASITLKERAIYYINVLDSITATNGLYSYYKYGNPLEKNFKDESPLFFGMYDSAATDYLIANHEQYGISQQANAASIAELALGTGLGGIITAAASSNGLIPKVNPVTGTLGLLAGSFGVINQVMAKRKLQAQIDDLRNVPNRISSNVGRPRFNTRYQTLAVFAEVSTLPVVQLNSLKTYFHKYGVAWDIFYRLDTDLITSRYWFNYVKCSRVYESIQLQVSVELKQIINESFKDGITIWHVRRDKSNNLTYLKINDYSKENTEITLVK